MANAASQLQEAFELIESGDLQAARQQLEAIRSQNENNPDYWWIYAHAVEDESDGLAALDQVRRLAPNYQGLQSLPEEVGIQPPSLTPPPVDALVSAPSTADIDDFNEQSTSAKARSSSNSSMGFVVAGVIAVIVVVAGLFWVANLLTGNNNDGEATQVAIIEDESPEPIIPTSDAASSNQDTPIPPPTQDVVAATEAPTSEVIQPPTDTPAPVNSDDPFAALYSDLAAFEVPADSIVTENTETFGDTYIIPTCSALGPVATQNILGIIDAMATNAPNFDSDVMGFAFEITDCSTDTVRLVLGVARTTVDEYWSGAIDQTQVQQALQRVN